MFKDSILDSPPIFIVRIDNTTNNSKMVSVIDAANSIHKCDEDGIFRYDGIVISSVFSLLNYREMLYFLMTSEEKIVTGTYITNIKSQKNENKEMEDFICIVESKSMNGCTYLSPILFKIDKKQNQKNIAYRKHKYRLSGVGSKFIINTEPQSSTEIRFYIPDSSVSIDDSNEEMTLEDIKVIEKLYKIFQGTREL